MIFSDMDDVKRANRDAGQHWFDPATIRFFDSKYSSELVEGRWFWSSEKAPDEPRRYTVREVAPEGRVSTVGEFQAYATREAAQRAIRALQNARTVELLRLRAEG